MEDKDSITNRIRAKTQHDLRNYASNAADFFVQRIREELQLPWYLHEQPLSLMRGKIAAMVVEAAEGCLVEKALKKAVEKLT